MKEDKKKDKQEKKETKTSETKEEKKKKQDGNGEKSGAPKAKAKSRSKRNDPEEPPQVKEPKRKARAAKKSEEPGPEKEVEKKEEDGKEDGKGKPEEVAKGRGRQKTAPESKPNPKPKAKRGAKSKASPKSKTQKTGRSGSKKEEDPEEIPTPKKRLFQSDDEEDGNEGLRLVDPKKQDKKPLKQILEEEMPRNWAKSRTKKGKGAEMGGTAEADPSPPKKRQRVNKVNLSPFAKKEVSRRKKKNQEVMQQEAEEDLALQGLCVQHLKNVKGMDGAAVKEYLLKKVHNKFNDFKLNTYWSRGSSGVKSMMLASDGTLKTAPEIAYFGRYGTAKSEPFNTVLVYVSSALMVSNLHSFFKLLHFQNKQPPRKQVN